MAQKEDASGKEKSAVTTPGAPIVGGGALTREAPLKLESTKERIEAIGDFSHLL